MEIGLLGIDLLWRVGLGMRRQEAKLTSAVSEEADLPLAVLAIFACLSPIPT